MARLLVLVRTLLLANLGLGGWRSPRHRRRALVTAIAITAGTAPLALLYAAGVGRIYTAIARQGLPLQDSVLAGIYALAQIVVLFTSVTAAYATLLRARDLSILLPLPYRPGQIVAAKLAVVWVLELCVSALFFLPPLAQHLAHTGAGPLRVLAAIPLALTLPVIPLCAGTLVVLIVGNIPGLGRSRWFWQLAMMMAMLSAWLVLRRVVPENGAAAAAGAVMAARMQQLEQIGRMLPGSLFAVRALTLTGPAAIANFLAALGAAVLAVAIVLAAADRLYLRPVLEGAGGGRGRGRAEAARPRPFVLSCARREIAGVLRDPAVAMNALGGYVALPMALAFSLLTGRSGQTGDGRGGLGFLTAFYAGDGPAPLRPLVTAAIGLAVASLSLLSSLFSASWSKDGRRLWLERSLPVDPFDVFVGKWLGCLAIASTAHAVACAVVGLLLHMPPATLLYAWLTGELALGAGGALGLAIDGMRPKLDWKETVQAVKQNANVMFGLLASAVLLGLNACVLYACFRLGAPTAVGWLAAPLLNLAALAGALALGRLAAARIADLEV